MSTGLNLGETVTSCEGSPLGAYWSAYWLHCHAAYGKLGNLGGVHHWLTSSSCKHKMDLPHSCQLNHSHDNSIVHPTSWEKKASRQGRRMYHSTTSTCSSVHAHSHITNIHLPHNLQTTTATCIGSFYLSPTILTYWSWGISPLLLLAHDLQKHNPKHSIIIKNLLKYIVHTCIHFLGKYWYISNAASAWDIKSKFCLRYMYTHTNYWFEASLGGYLCGQLFQKRVDRFKTSSWVWNQSSYKLGCNIHTYLYVVVPVDLCFPYKFSWHHTYMYTAQYT